MLGKHSSQRMITTYQKSRSEKKGGCLNRGDLEERRKVVYVGRLKPGGMKSQSFGDAHRTGMLKIPRSKTSKHQDILMCDWSLVLMQKCVERKGPNNKNAGWVLAESGLYRD